MLQLEPLFVDLINFPLSPKAKNWLLPNVNPFKSKPVAPDVREVQLEPLSTEEYIAPLAPQPTNVELPNATSTKLVVEIVFQLDPLSVDLINLVPRATNVLLPCATPFKFELSLQVPAFQVDPLSCDCRMVPL